MYVTKIYGTPVNVSDIEAGMQFESYNLKGATRNNVANVLS